jgi:hypothetical protein
LPVGENTTLVRKKYHPRTVSLAQLGDRVAMVASLSLKKGDRDGVLLYLPNSCDENTNGGGNGTVFVLQSFP